MDDSGPIPWLVVVLRPKLTLGISPEDPGPAFLADGVRFETDSADALTGFYDRLYDLNRHFVGIQIGLLTDRELIDEAWAWPYIRKVTGAPQIQVILSSSEPDEILMTPDQAFGGRVYRSSTGGYALSLDTYFLDDAERSALKMGPARWVSIIPLND